jgi:transcription initiation factor IIE alpha subunit
MSDLTIYAEALIATAARAFYDDEVVSLIDVLIRDKFLRDDDMAPRLSLPAKKLRATLYFLEQEHLVRLEQVDDLAQGGSQSTKFYYLDYNRAVHSIRLRLHLLRKKLEAAELGARSSSFYLCPGYHQKRCNGRYTEEEAQQVLDFTSGLFLCQECSVAYENDPNAPAKETYTLQLVDNTRDLRLAMDNLRRSNVQLSAKSIGNQQLRAGIYDLLQKVRGSKGGKYSAAAQPITSNLPSENFALGIGSKRLAGTGRTVGIKVKKLELQGVVDSAAQARNYLVGGGDGVARGTDEGDFLFLKNAMGHEMQFTVERGGGARAQLLATRRRRRRKLMDAAASRVGASLPLYLQVAEARRRRQEAELAKQKDGKNKTNTNLSLDFLIDNIGRMGQIHAATTISTFPDDVSLGESVDMEPELILVDELDEVRKLPEDKRLASFQAQYKVEVDRQVKLLELEEVEPPGSPRRASSVEDEDQTVIWEDGEWE